MSFYGQDYDHGWTDDTAQLEDLQLQDEVRRELRRLRARRIAPGHPRG